jgi:hypothetical protein
MNHGGNWGELGRWYTYDMYLKGSGAGLLFEDDGTHLTYELRSLLPRLKETDNPRWMMCYL